MTERVAPGTRPRGRRDTRRLRLGWFVVLSLLLHVPLTPLAGLFGLLALLHRESKPAPEEQLHAIPVSLLSPEEMAALGLGPEQPKQPSTTPAEPPKDDSVPQDLTADAPPKPKPKPKSKPKPEAADGGVRVEQDGGPRPPEHDAGPKLAEHAAPRGADAGAPPSARVAESHDPLDVVGKATSVADPNANVKLLLLNDRIRGLAIAPRIGALVARLPQWQSFFGPTTLDPIRDIERIYVAGPQFRVSADVVAIVEYGVPRATIKNAIDRIVAREPRGQWFDGPTPAALAHADRADRVFVLPKKKIVLMVPPHLKDDAIEKAPSMSFPSIGGKAAAVAFIKNPSHALRGLGLGVDLPHGIDSASVSVTPADDGGATLDIIAIDASPEAASDDAALLTQAINALTQRDVGALGALLFGGQTLSLIERVSLVADGKKIEGTARITPRQLDRILGFAEAWVDSISGPAPHPSAVPSSRPRAHSPSGTP